MRSWIISRGAEIKKSAILQKEIARSFMPLHNYSSFMSTMNKVKTKNINKYSDIYYLSF